MIIGGKRFIFSSPFGPHRLALWWNGPKTPPRMVMAHDGFARYAWNTWGQCIGVYSMRDFEKDPIP